MGLNEGRLLFRSLERGASGLEDGAGVTTFEGSELASLEASGLVLEVKEKGGNSYQC